MHAPHQQQRTLGNKIHKRSEIVTEIEHFRYRSCLVTATKQNLQTKFSLTGLEKVQVPHFRCSQGLLGTPDLVIVLEKKKVPKKIHLKSLF